MPALELPCSAQRAACRLPPTAAHLLGPQDKQRKQRLSALADRLSCALFGIANTVTALFFAIEKSTKVRQAAFQPGGPCSPYLAVRLLSLSLPRPAGLRSLSTVPSALTPALPHPRLPSLQGLVEGGGLERPAWLNLAVHVANSAVAWLDLLIGE